MQQIQTKTRLTATRSSDFFQNMVFKLLARATAGLLTMKLGEEVFQFGDKDAQLKAEVQVYDRQIFKTLMFKGSIGIAEDYVAGKWNSPDLTRVIEFFVANQNALDAVEKKFGALVRLGYFLKKFKNRNNETQAKKNILAHYDLGNHLYKRFLDSQMQYSSAIYPETMTDLESAQIHKMETICQRLQLQPGESVLEIGTGWGGLAVYMAKHYAVNVTTTTISDAQHDYAQQRIAKAGLQDKITLLKQDYRKLSGQFDKLVSIEMIEAVGHEYLDGFFKQCSDLLKPEGLLLIQAITIADQRYEHYRKEVDFIQTYIFPGGCLPSVQRMSQCLTNNTDMVIHELHDIGLHYARTLADWREKFLAAWPQLAQEGFDQQFKRLWTYYLCYCEGGFLQRAISTVHLVSRKPQFSG
ncbi:cyclopropane-fatty-acyl-phospholipid synthase family protein [Planctobacterium marinum]|nr:cyclopropane-fatty-acyl-phospholipid synthase family protein [Planctobacterium marinum]MCC2606995.1 cyclopropane-fatty-acyl-phospholipid synthase family protein [Planctobacterium marinum]